MAPGYTGEEHPEVVDIRAMPPQPKELKPGQVPENLIKQYFEEGYFQLDKFFDPTTELNPCREAIGELVEELAQKLYKGGKIKSLHKDCGLFERLTKLDEEFPGANIILHKTGKLPEAFMKVWGNERLLNLMEQILGSDIGGMPDWSLRCKIPKTDAATVPWHQDLGYQSVDAYQTLVVTVWIPFVDSNEQNGCMQIIPRGHLKGKVGRHYSCVGDTWYVNLPEEEMKNNLGVDVKDAKTCPVPYGGILVFSNFLPHRSLENYSNGIRWSVDFRFKKTGLPNGMHGLKNDVILRSSKNPDMKIDWSMFNAVERLKIKKNSDGSIVDRNDDDFDTTISGPWIRKWELVHSNRHTDQAWKEYM